MPRVELTIEPDPSYVRTARQVAVAVARRAGLPDDTVADVRLAVGEATGLLLRLDPDHDERVRLGFVDDAGLAVDLTADVPLPTGPEDPAGPGATGPDDDDLDGSADGALPVPAVLGLLHELAGGLDVAHGPDGVRLTMRWDRAGAVADDAGDEASPGA